MYLSKCRLRKIIKYTYLCRCVSSVVGEPKRWCAAPFGASLRRGRTQGASDGSTSRCRCKIRYMYM